MFPCTKNTLGSFINIPTPSLTGDVYDQVLGVISAVGRHRIRMTADGNNAWFKTNFIEKTNRRIQILNLEVICMKAETSFGDTPSEDADRTQLGSFRGLSELCKKCICAFHCTKLIQLLSTLFTILVEACGPLFLTRK